MSKNILTLSFALGLLLCLIDIAEACSCRREPNPPCRAFWDTQAIFDGVVVKVTPINPGGFSQRSVRFSVENAYRGVKGKEVTVVTGDGGSDCGYTFTEGKRYLVYAYGSSEQLETNYCTRTRPIEYADEDLQYIKGLPNAPEGATIYGTVKRYAFGFGDDEDWGRTSPVEGIKISIKGKGSNLTAVTDKEGKFFLTGLAPGSYTIEALLPDTLKLSIHDFRGGAYALVLKNRGCAETSFRVNYEGRISGRIFDDKGEPLKGIQVQITSADEEGYGSGFELTDDEGRFEYTGLPPGRYLIGVALFGEPRYLPPYPPTYYPGVSDPAKASVIDLTKNSTFKDINFRLPPKIR